MAGRLSQIRWRARLAAHMRFKRSGQTPVEHSAWENPGVSEKEPVDWIYFQCIAWDQWEDFESRKKQSDMEGKSFARIVERQVRKALKTEREEGECQQKAQRSIWYRRGSALHNRTELACFKLFGWIMCWVWLMTHTKRKVLSIHYVPLH